jgi:hypothetical protein
MYFPLSYSLLLTDIEQKILDGSIMAMAADMHHYLSTCPKPVPEKTAKETEYYIELLQGVNLLLHSRGALELNCPHCILIITNIIADYHPPEYNWKDAERLLKECTKFMTDVGIFMAGNSSANDNVPRNARGHVLH